MSHILNSKDVGVITAYGEALEGGYQGTREQLYASISSSGLTLPIDPQSPSERELFITTQGIPVYVPPAWETGTADGIKKALRKHYTGEIDLADYWHVGDTRSFDLSAIAAFSGGYAQAAQTITLTIMNVGGRTLVDNVTECAFVLGMTRTLTTTETRSGTWDTSNIRNWLNGAVRNAFDSDIVDIFQRHVNNTYVYNSSLSRYMTVSTSDYFTIPSSHEIFGATISDVNPSDGSMLSYYTDSTKRSKGTTYWTRSIRTNSNSTVYVNSTGTGIANASSSSRYGISLQCVI